MAQIKMLVSSDPPEPRAPRWTSELIHSLVEGMQACRWFLATGFDPPEQFGSWLRRRLEENELGPPDGPHGDFYVSWAWHAADAVDQLRKEWRPEWSM